LLSPPLTGLHEGQRRLEGRLQHDLLDQALSDGLGGGQKLAEASLHPRHSGLGGQAAELSLDLVVVIIIVIIIVVIKQL
jgi:hypothetical protein